MLGVTPSVETNSYWHTRRFDDLAAIKKAAVAAWSKSKPTVLEIPISAQVPPLI
jgi:hypothetical protein